MNLDLEIGVAVAVGVRLDESSNLIGVAAVMAETKREVIFAEIRKADKMKRFVLRGVVIRIDPAEINPVGALVKSRM